MQATGCCYISILSADAKTPRDQAGPFVPTLASSSPASLSHPRDAALLASSAEAEG